MTAQKTDSFIVCLEDVLVRIQGTTVLRNIDWCVRAGEHWGIVGPNGSGKSSLLGLVAGQLWPAPGHGKRTYSFDGRARRDAVEAKKRITFVGPELQNRYAKLGWNFSALDVVLTGIFRTEIPRRKSRRSERAKARAILEEFSIEHLADRPFLELSRGEQRRVLIARGIAFEPELLLLDEPTSGLDSTARPALEETIERASKRATIIASAHHIENLPRVVRRYIELEGGRINASGTVSETGQRTDAARTEVPLCTRARSRSAAGPPCVEIIDADVWLADRHVLKSINWTLESDQHWLVLGANGAGKTTFLRLLHGQLRPERGGTLRWPALGNPRNVWALRRHIGWVAPELQASYRYPTTVLECVASGFKSSIGLTHRLTMTERKRVDALLERFELAGLRDRPLSSLSYGQFRRVLIARTFVTEPRLLLMDEPWEGLDADSIQIVSREIQRATHHGTQLVCISHVGDAGLKFTHEMVIDDGCILRASRRALKRERGVA